MKNKINTISRGIGIGVYNHSKMAFHTEKLQDLSDRKISTPLYVRVKPTNKCNHRCFYCSYDSDFGYLLSEKKFSKDEIAKEKMMEILKDFKDMGVKAVTYSGGGEPLVYPHIVDAFRKTLENKIDLSIITNGQLLNGERRELLSQSEWVRISTDYTDAQSFAQVRRVSGNNYNRLINNIESFAKIKKKECELGISFIVNHFNADKIYEATKLFKNLGADHIRFSPVYIPDNHELARNAAEYHNKIKRKVRQGINKSFELQNDNFNVFNFYDHDFDSVMNSVRPYERCFMMEIVPVIAANEKVYFCHDKAYSDSGLLGIIKDKSFRELWFSPESKIRFENFNPIAGCKHHCTADGRNLSIQEMICNKGDIQKHTPHTEKHKNFI